MSGLSSLFTKPALSIAPTFDQLFRSGTVGERSARTNAASDNLRSQFASLIGRQELDPANQSTLQSPIRTAPARPGQSSSTESKALSSRLDSVDPRLAGQYQALFDFLAETNPEAAEVLERVAHKVLDHLDGVGSASTGSQTVNATPQPAVNQPVSAERSQQITVALEASITRLQIELQTGEQLSAEQVRISVQAVFSEQLGQSDPLMLDLDGNGVETTTPENGHLFDLTGTGHLVRAATVAGNDAYLALDRNRNGSIDSGRELFGDQNGAVDGFAELRKLDANGDGRIDASDPTFGELQLFRDVNRDGKTQLGELARLADANVAAILLNAEPATEDSNGNQIVKQSSFVRNDGSSGDIADVLLNYIV